MRDKLLTHRIFLAALFLGAEFTLAPYAVGAQQPEPSAPFISAVKHAPQQPHPDESVTITADFRSEPKSVSIEYQIVEPGGYISLNDPGYKSGWTPVLMIKIASDALPRYSAKIPQNVQIHRRLVRYRIKALLPDGSISIAPPAADPEPNFAYFVFSGISPWKAAIEPKGNDSKKSEVVTFGINVMDQVQNYFLLAKSKEVETATWYERSSGKEYKYTGTFVAQGKVYDHVHFRARGGVWRHAMGKNMWKVSFNKGHHFQAQDDYGRPYHTKWSKLNLRSCIQQGDYGRRGEQGMYESVGFRLFNLVGADAPRTHWISWRIVDEKNENPSDQYHGDFWGLYLAIENEDGHFLAEHNLPDGNLYKMMFGQGELANVGANQATNKSDLQRFAMNLHRNNLPESWWRTNVDLPRYYSYRSIIEAIHHYDVSDGKNYDFYLNPKANQWCVIPWDIDLTWGDHMYGGGVEPFLYPVLSRPTLKLEYQNRLREIRDLLFNPDETGRLIDECAAIISRPRGMPSIVDADRAKWDYHPIMASRYAMRGKADQGLFYQDSRTRDFAGMVRQMKDYVKQRDSYIDGTLIADRSIPETPVITFIGKGGYAPDSLSFRTSAFSGGKFSAMKWRLGEIDTAPIIQKPIQPGHYEITPVWESGETPNFKEEITIPAQAVKSGHTYRVRVRMKSEGGRWSHWSSPIQFVAGEGPK